MKATLFILVLIQAQLALGLDIQFIRGNTIDFDAYAGRVSARCDGNYRSYYCSADILAGGDYGAIQVNETIDADWLKLQRVGSKYIKGAKFDSENGRTGHNYNLWLASFFQRPLLDYGKNTIKYTFTKNKQVVLEGTFEVVVQKRDNYNCYNGHLVYNGSCPSVTTICDDYLFRRNYCR